MFEYNLISLKIYGFIKIKYIDENKLEFKYKNKELIVRGKALNIINLLDKSVEVKGLIEGLDITYKGGKND